MVEIINKTSSKQTIQKVTGEVTVLPFGSVTIDMKEVPRYEQDRITTFCEIKSVQKKQVKQNVTVKSPVESEPKKK